MVIRNPLTDRIDLAALARLCETCCSSSDADKDVMLCPRLTCCKVRKGRSIQCLEHAEVVC